MKYCITLFVSMLMFQFTWSQEQKGDKFFAFDPEWKSIDLTKAFYLVRIRKLSENDFMLSTYQAYGPRLSQERFIDDSCTIKNGECRYYHLNGRLDSLGNFKSNLQDGEWWYRDQDGYSIAKKIFSNGVLVRDSLIVREPPQNKPAIKPKANPGEIESSFRGGADGWKRFMTNNFKYPVRAQNSSVGGTVVLDFIVDEKGLVQDPEISSSVEYSIDEEALRLIRKSPSWQPASKDGVPVKSYKKQPVTFSMN